MRAVVIREFGPPEVLELTEVAEPGPGRARSSIDVAFANVTFVETQVRAGRPPHPAMLPALPAILGNGVGGTVIAVGPGVDPDLVGRAVVASLGGSGGYAEQRGGRRRHVSSRCRTRCPLRDAVALLADGRTAMACWAGPTCARARRSWSRPRPAAWARCWSSSPATRARGSSRWPAADASWPLARELGRRRDRRLPPRRLGAQVRDAAGDGGRGVRRRRRGHRRGGVRAARPGGRFCPFGMASGGFAPVHAGAGRGRARSTCCAAAPTSPAESARAVAGGPGRGRGGPAAAGHRPGASTWPRRPRRTPRSRPARPSARRC